MGATSNPALSPSEGFGKKLRNAAIGTLFALVLLVPRLLHLRRSPRSWMLFRILLGLAGTSLVIWPVGLGNSYFLSLVGLAMFIGAILLPPAKPGTNADDKARELGALVIVNGGRYRPGNAPSAAVQLFVGAERLWVLDRQFQTVLVIPVNEMTAARADQSEGRWLLRIEWADHAAQFYYRGVFAEHLARVAESTLHSVMRPSLPVIPQRRVASA
jgi:hypothetical protein